MSIFLWAHRGASRWAPENTMAAFRLAERSGAEGIELDVHLSRDGVPVVLHDETLDRTTDGIGPVRRATLRELRRLDAGRWFSSRFAGESIPTLQEVLAWAGARLRINVEIKSAEAGEAVVRLLEEHPQSRVLVSSFNLRLLEEIRSVAPGLPLGFLVEGIWWRRALARAVECRAESLHPRGDGTSSLLIRACHRRGLKVYPWTVDDRLQFQRLVHRGIDGVFTNDPAALKGCLGQVSGMPSKNRF